MTTLYRLYARGGVLLYIGIANRVTRRLAEHARDKPWWPEVVNLTFETHPDRATAEAAERSAIRSECPRHNIVHATVRVDPQPVATIDWSCQVCTKPIADGKGYVWIDHNEVAAAQARDARQDPITGEVDLSDFLTISDANWHVHHAKCDPYPNANSYTIAIERIRTVPQLLDWTAHLMSSKGWISATDWDRFLSAVATQIAGEQRPLPRTIRAI